MWQCRSLTRLLPWKNARQIISVQHNVIPWALYRAFSVEAADPEIQGFTSPNQARPLGSIYAKLLGTGRYTFKTDIAHYFDGCGLTPEDIKVAYTRAYTPTGMILQFPSRAAYATALRMVAAKGRQYWLQEADRFLWSNALSFEGKVVLMSGIPRNALNDDVERFLSGCDYINSSLRFFLRQEPDEAAIRLAFVNCLTENDAMNIQREKNQSICLNNPVTVRVLH